MFRRFPPLSLINGLLRMLNANTHRKGLLFHSEALVATQLEHVTRRMTACQHQFSSSNFFARARFHVFQLHGSKLAFRKAPPRKARAEAHFTATLDHFVAHGAHDTRQVIAAQVRMGVDQDAFGRASVNEPMQHMLCERILDIGSELSVRKRARSTFAELNVGMRVQGARCVEGRNVFGAPLHIEAALHHQGAKPAAGQIQRGKKPSRTQTHYHNPAALIAIGMGAVGARKRLVFFCHANVQAFWRPFKQALFLRLRQFDAKRSGEMNVVPLARIHAFARQNSAADIALGNAQSARDFLRLHFGIFRQRRIQRKANARNL